MCNLESENNILIQEVKKACKVETVLAKLKTEQTQKQMEKLTCE